MTQIIWREQTVKFGTLKAFENNPRLINKEQFQRLVKSLKENGYNNRILCDIDLTIIGGHMRKSAMVEVGFKDDDDITILVPNRKLTNKEFERINIQDNVSFGQWDIDILANHFEIDELIDWGVNEDLFKDLTLEEKEIDVLDKDTLKEEYLLQFTFQNEDELEEAYEKFTKEGYKCKVLIL